MIELTCAGVVNILKYIPGVQGVDDAVRPCSLALILNELKTQTMCKKSVEDDPGSLGYIPDRLITQEMCSSAVSREPCTLRYVHDHLKTEKMCDKAVRIKPCLLEFVPNRLKTQKMCKKAVKNKPDSLRFVPDHFKTQKMCDKVVRDGSPIFLEHDPDWLITKQQLKLMGEHCNNIWFIKRYEGYKKRKTQKAKIKDELIPIAWHPSRWWYWCVPEDEKKETEKLWG